MSAILTAVFLLRKCNCSTRDIFGENDLSNAEGINLVPISHFPANLMRTFTQFQFPFAMPCARVPNRFIHFHSCTHTNTGRTMDIYTKGDGENLPRSLTIPVWKKPLKHGFPGRLGRWISLPSLTFPFPFQCRPLWRIEPLKPFAAIVCFPFGISRLSETIKRNKPVSRPPREREIRSTKFPSLLFLA